ncbi:MAG TPA: hypothetical protein VK586_14080 [Streptosporangiaceae bacterium]|nr:hypothetical protein [Streptosporangiaceae bacterium]
MVAAFAGGALLGTLAAGWLRGVRRPAIAGSAAFIAEAVFLAAAPYPAAFGPMAPPWPPSAS